MNGKSILAGILLFALGLFLGTSYLRPAQQAKSPVPSSGLEKLQSLAEGDLEDYYRLRTMEERYAKADEILGKIMVIFLADLGLHVSKQAQEAAQNRAVITERGSEPPKVVPVAAPASLAMPTLEERSRPLLDRLNLNERGLLQARDERSVDGLLRRVKLSDFGTALSASKGFSNRADTLGSLNGGFEGRTRVRLEGKNEAWYVHLEVAAAMQNKKLAGQVRTRLLKDGKVFSDSNSNGDNLEVFREFSGDSAALLVKVNDKLFLQAYYLKELDMLATNIYRRGSEAEGFEHIGSAQLKRAQ